MNAKRPDPAKLTSTEKDALIRELRRQVAATQSEARLLRRRLGMAEQGRARADAVDRGGQELLEALRQAAAFYREVNVSAGEDRSDRERALLGQARLSYEWNILETARQEAEEALDLGTCLGDEAVRVQASLILAEAAAMLAECLEPRIAKRMPGITDLTTPLVRLASIRRCRLGMMPRPGDTSRAAPGSRKPRCMSITSRAVRAGSSRCSSSIRCCFRPSNGSSAATVLSLAWIG